MLYSFPDIWSEDAFKALPEEDDRFEFKSGLLLDDVINKSKTQDALEETLSKEIGALVNSFGGTLFIGVKDKTKLIDGCPILFKGKETTKDWLEKKIPEWFEFRLYSFRVNYVTLTSPTKKRITKDRALIHIDIWDSGFLPHQIKKSGYYYYRESSVARKAPHHYLTFLWTMRSPNMSEKVRKWCLEFLNPVIEFLSGARMFLESRAYKATTRLVENAQTVSEIELFAVFRWHDLISSNNLAAKQFFFNYPHISKQCSDLWENGINLLRSFVELRRAIENTCVIEEQAGVLIKKANSQYENYEIPTERGRLLRNFAGQFGSSLSQLHDELAAQEIGGLIAQMTGWRLLGIDPFFQVTEPGLWSLSEIVKDLVEDIPAVKTATDEVDFKISSLAEEIRTLHAQFDQQRDQLAATHVTTYF